MSPPLPRRTAGHAAMALPTAAVITKRITLPAGLTEEDYEVQVESEASQYIPFSIDEVNLDFQILGPAAHGAEDVEVLLAASRRDRVEDCVAIAADKRFGVQAMTLNMEFQKIFPVTQRLMIGLAGLGTDVQTLYALYFFAS